MNCVKYRCELRVLKFLGHSGCTKNNLCDKSDFPIRMYGRKSREIEEYRVSYSQQREYIEKNKIEILADWVSKVGRLIK